jgi:IS4 transposase
VFSTYEHWAVFLSTDVNLEAAKVLEIYALRWAVEVYFKEAKQHLGFLKEQSIHYAAYIASISHVTLYLAFQLQYSPVQTATEHFATVLSPYPNWSDSVGHPEFCTDKVGRS